MSSAAARTVPLFEEQMTLERAIEIAARFPIVAKFRFGTFYRKEGGRRFGPYRKWFAYWWSPAEGPGSRGTRVHLYVGDDRKKREVELAHALLRTMLDEATAAVAKLPQVKRLRELQQLAGAKEGDDTVAVVNVVGSVK